LFKAEPALNPEEEAKAMANMRLAYQVKNLNFKGFFDIFVN